MDDIFPRPVKEMLFMETLGHLLKKQPSKDNYEYFIEQAARGYVLDIGKMWYMNVVFIAHLYEELQKKNENLIVNIITEIFSQLHDKRSIREKAWTDYNSVNETDVFGKFSKGLNLYKTLFETEFKLRSTIMYLYFAEELDTSKKLEDSSQYVNLSAGNKLENLKKCPTFRGVGNIQMLIAPFNNQIRNAGSWHDDYDIWDDNICHLKVIVASSGKVKKTIDLTLEELDKYMKDCEKTLRILEVGLKVFLSNNPEIEKKIIINRWLKIKEVERLVLNRANELQLEVIKLNINKDSGLIYLEVKNKRTIGWLWWEVISSSGFYSKVTNKNKEVKYIDQAFSLIRTILMCYEWQKFDLWLKIFDDKNSLISEMEFDKEEVNKLTCSTKQDKKYPNPEKWELPSETYTIQAQSLG